MSAKVLVLVVWKCISGNENYERMSGMGDPDHSIKLSLQTALYLITKKSKHNEGI